ncbi:MAG: glycosyltransferase family 39 protein, partial [Candidatus Rokuibacteriota bacterium]
WWQRPRVALALVVTAGALLRIYRYDALSLWVDEGATVHVARLPWTTVLGLRGAYDVHPPLYFAVVKLATRFATELHAARLVSVVAGTATIPILYTLAARMLGTRAALVASVALAVSPVHIWYSQEARMYALGTLLVGVSYLALVAFYQSPARTWAVLYSLSVLFAMYSNYGAVYSLVPQIVLLAATTRKHARRSLPLWIAVAAAVLGVLPWLPELLKTTTALGMSRQSYLGVSLNGIGRSVLAIVGLLGNGSYFFGSPTPWDRWRPMHPILILGLGLTIVVGTAALARRSRLALAIVLVSLPGTVLVAAGLSLVSPGYAVRTVLVGVLGWVLVLGALPFGRASTWVRTAGAVGALLTVSMSLLTLRAIYTGADKQHWAQLASQTALAAEFNRPVWVYPTYAGTLIDVYQPSVLGLSGTRSARSVLNRVIADGADAPTFDGDAIWLVYIEAAGIERVRHQLAERGYELTMHRYHEHQLYIDLYLKAGVDWGRQIPIRFRDDGSHVLHLTQESFDSTAAVSAPAMGGRLYIVGFDVRTVLPSSRLQAFLGCASEMALLEVASDGHSALVPSDGQWHRRSIGTICPLGAVHVLVNLRNVGPGDLAIRDVTLREVNPAATMRWP